MIEIAAEIRASLPAWAWDPLVVLLAATVGIVAGLVAHRILFGILRRVVKSSESKADDVIVDHLARPLHWALVALGVVLAARETPQLDAVWQKFAGFVMPAVLGWIALAVVRALVHAAELNMDIAVADNLRARRQRTRLTIFLRLATFLIMFVTVGLMLLSIPGVRDIGVALMASAGLAGLAVGAAAQPALKSLIGGLQMALTEPVRIDDVVIIGGEWGRIEDIRTTYVVVRTWDERRLIVPTVKFLEETFQNWTREGSELLGPVFLRLDPLADVELLRNEFDRYVESHPLWDGRTKSVQVTDSAPESIEVRLLVSSRNSGEIWDLRCAVREHMLGWIRDNGPRSIARRRFEPAASPEGATA